MPLTRGDTKMDKSGSSDSSVENLVKQICSTFVSQLTVKMDEMDSKLAKMDKKLNDKLGKLDKLDEINTKLNSINVSVNSLSQTVASNSSAIKLLNNNLGSLEQSSKSNSLRFHGFEEVDNEVVLELVSSFITNSLGMSCLPSDINYAFRIGKAEIKFDHPRPILVNFVNNWRKSAVYSARKLLKRSGQNISIFEDLTKSRYEALKTAKEKYGKDKVWTSGGKIYFHKDGKRLPYHNNIDG